LERFTPLDDAGLKKVAPKTIRHFSTVEVGKNVHL